MGPQLLHQMWTEILQVQMAVLSCTWMDFGARYLTTPSSSATHQLFTTAETDLAWCAFNCMPTQYTASCHSTTTATFISHTASPSHCHMDGTLSRLQTQGVSSYCGSAQTNKYWQHSTYKHSREIETLPIIDALVLFYRPYRLKLHLALCVTIDMSCVLCYFSIGCLSCSCNG